MKRQMRDRINLYLGWFLMVLVALQVLVVLFSWFVTAAMPEAALRSLLSAEGVRWLFGHYVENMAQAPLVWLLLAAMAHGALRKSGLMQAVKAFRHTGYRQRFALKVVLCEMVVLLCCVLLLTAVPHAVLLGITGSLYPGSFVTGLVPLLCFGIMMLSLTYGLLSGALAGVRGMFEALCCGMVWWQYIIPLYLVAAQLWFSIKFVLQI